MIVYNLDFLRALSCPYKAYSVFIVNAYAATSDSIAFEAFQPVTRRHPQIVQSFHSIQHRKLAHRYCLNTYETPDTFAVKQPFRFGALERPDRRRKILM